jgi:hypothetical protein
MEMEPATGSQGMRAEFWRGNSYETGVIGRNSGLTFLRSCSLAVVLVLMVLDLELGSQFSLSMFKLVSMNDVLWMVLYPSVYRVKTFVIIPYQPRRGNDLDVKTVQ